jgi:hypothetical protein
MTEALQEISRPLFKDHWQRLRRSLEVLREKRPYQRSVARLTVLKDKNMDKDREGGIDTSPVRGQMDLSLWIPQINPNSTKALVPIAKSNVK